MVSWVDFLIVLVVVAIVVPTDQLRSSCAINPLDSTQQFGFAKTKHRTFDVAKSSSLQDSIQERWTEID